MGHDQLGTRESLASIDPTSLRLAHETGYSRNRCVLFVAGDIEPSQLLDVIEPCVERLSDRLLTPREVPDTYGELPEWQAGTTTRLESQHDDSVVYLLFPMPRLKSLDGGETIQKGLEQVMQWDFLNEVFAAGELGSPLNRLIREDAQLAYSPDFVSTTHPDGGYAGLVAQTSVEPERVLDAFWKLIASPQLRSPTWLEYVRDTIRGSIEMHDPDAGQYTEGGAASLIHYGQCFSDAEYAETLLNYRDDEIAHWLDTLVPEQSHSIIFEGRG